MKQKPNYILNNFCYAAIFIGTLIGINVPNNAKAQVVTTIDSLPPVPPVPRPTEISIIAPFYLDSLFVNGKYRYTNSIPKFILPALEFYNGVQIAADSLELAGVQVKINIIDSRKNGSLIYALASPALLTSDLIIGIAQNAAELRNMVKAADKNNKPFISVNYPNDGGITQTPNLVIVNSTLKTHCEGLYKHLQSKKSTENIILLTRNSSVGDFIKNYLMDVHENTPSVPLDWKVITIEDNGDPAAIRKYLDSNRQNNIIVSSLNEVFAEKLLTQLGSYSKSFPLSVYGMPTWDNYKLNKPEYKGVDIYYSTAYISAVGNNSIYKNVVNDYKIRANSLPSDMALRGFETTLRFVQTLHNHRGSGMFLDNLNDPQVNVLTNFNFQPIRNKTTNEIDYYENKKVYFIHTLDGIVKGVQ